VIFYILVKTHVPLGLVRGAIAVAIVIAVLRWLPQSAAPLGFGGWLGSWLRAGSPPGGPKDAISGRPL
jgi:hypothetical protein